MCYIPWYIACYITCFLQAGLLDCEKLQSMSVELLELLKSNMLDKTGEKSSWNFEKAHSILHKVQLRLPVCFFMLYDMLYNLLYNRSEKSSFSAELRTLAPKGQNIATSNLHQQQGHIPHHPAVACQGCALAVFT